MIKKACIFISILLVFCTLFMLNMNVSDAVSIKSKDQLDQTFIIGTFERDLEGWTAGTNVQKVQRVSTCLNGPGTAYEGTYMLEAQSTVVSGTSWRTIQKSFSPALDVSKTPYFQLAVNSYGLPAGNTLELRVTFYSGSASTSVTSSISGDKWNLVSVNISDWAYKNAVSKIEISWRSGTYSSPWHACHQIDYAGFGTSEDWNFDTNGNFENWTFNSQYSNGQVSGGYLNLGVIGTDPYMYSPANINIDAKYSKYLNIRFKNSTNATKGKIYWLTTQDSSFSESRCLEFDIVPYDNQYTVYSIDLSASREWKNLIKQLRLDLPNNGNGTGSISIDYIKVDTMPESTFYRWDFDSDNKYEGWTFIHHMSSGSVKGGYLNANITGTDPHMQVSGYRINADASKVKYLTVRLKNSTSGNTARLYWTTNVDGTMNEAKAISFSIIPNDNTYRTYSIDLSGISSWNSIIDIIRLDLPQNGSGSGSISVGYIELDTSPENVYYSGSVETIAATNNNITVTGFVNCTTSKQIELVELQPYETFSFYKKYTPVGTMNVTPQGGVAGFTFNIPRYDGQRDRIYSKFVVVVNDTVRMKLDVEKYVTEFPTTSNNFPFPTAPSIKGLQVQLTDDAKKLGVWHAALNYPISNLFRKDNSVPGDTLTYTMDGETFYLRKSFVESMDKQIRDLSNNGCVVTLILVFYPTLQEDAPNDLIVHPDYIDGIVAAVNTTNAIGVKYWKAAIEFIVERYTRNDQAYGRAVNYIIGNEVDIQRDWNDMGYKELCDYIDQYARTFRIAHTAAKKKYINARVYISLTHFWNATAGSDAWRYYKGKDIVDGFNARIKEEGNIFWHVAHHPYPENLFDCKVWEDTTATNSFLTQRITFKNLHILSDYLGQSDYLFNGQRRRIILSEQGFHTPDSSMSSQQIQAAAYAYSYYKAKFTEGIDAFILHRHVDHGGEGGLNLGIWTRNTGKSHPAVPYTKKYLYEVFRKIDTAESLTVTNFAKSIIGISDWSQVIPNWDPTKLADVTLPQVNTVTKPSSINPVAYLSNFETGTDGWEPCEYGNTATQVSTFLNNPQTPYNGSHALEISFATHESSHGGYAEKGVTKKYATPINVTNTPKFQLAINSYGGCPGATEYYVTIRIYSGTNCVTGTTTISPNQWNLVSMDISNWAYKNSVDKVKVWFSCNSGESWGGAFQIDYAGFAS